MTPITLILFLSSLGLLGVANASLYVLLPLQTNYTEMSIHHFATVVSGVSTFVEDPNAGSVYYGAGTQAAHAQVQVVNSILPASYSYTVWIQPSSGSYSNQIVIGNTGSAGIGGTSVQNAFYLSWDTTSGFFMYAGQYASTVELKVADSTRLYAGVWYFFVVTYDASLGTLSVYRDGDLVNYGTANSAHKNAWTGGAEISVGTSSRSGGNSWGGYIYDCRVYSGVLAQSDVTSIYFGEDGYADLPASGATSAPTTPPASLYMWVPMQYNFNDYSSSSSGIVPTVTPTSGGFAPTFINGSSVSFIANVQVSSWVPSGSSTANVFYNTSTTPRSFSVSVWVYPTTSSQCVIVKGAGAPPNSWVLGATGTGVSGHFDVFYASISNSAAVVYDTSTYSGSQWYHLGLTYNEFTGVLSLYRDGTFRSYATLDSGSATAWDGTSAKISLS